MEFDEALYGRASVRAFSDEAIDDETVEALLRAAMAAPSAGNQQPWAFYVVRDGQLRAALAAASPYAGPAAKAPVVIVACMALQRAKFPQNAQQDLAAAVENMLLAAVDTGLGAVWLGIAPERDRMDAVAGALTLPEGTEPFALIALGRPAAQPQPACATRYDKTRVTWL